MKIECPGCQAKFSVDDSKIPARGAKTKCPKCGGPIFIQKPEPVFEQKPEQVFEQKPKPGQADFDDDRIACPSCGYRQKPGRECVSCGVVFEKLERRQPPESAPPPGPPPFPPGDEAYSPPPPMPPGGPARSYPSRMLPAILVTLFCCLPTGVAAIIFAARVGSRQAAGDYEGARSASRAAGILCLVSLAMGVVTVVVLGIMSAIMIPQFMKYSEKAGEYQPVPMDSENQETNEGRSYIQILTEMKSKGQDIAAGAALNNLKTAQDAYHLEYDSYASSVDELKEWWQPESMVEVEIIEADNDSWSAWARYNDSPNRFTYSSSGGN